MKKPRLGTNDWGTDDWGDEQGFFNSWVTCDERNAHHGGDLPLSGCDRIEHFVSPFRPSLDPSIGSIPWTTLCRLLSEPPLALLLDPSRMVELDCSPMVLVVLAASVAGVAIVRRGRMFPCVELLIYQMMSLPPSQLEPAESCIMFIEIRALRTLSLRGETATQKTGLRCWRERVSKVLMVFRSASSVELSTFTLRSEAAYSSRQQAHTEDFIEGAVTDQRASMSFLDPGAMGGLKPLYYLPSPWRGVTQC